MIEGFSWFSASPSIGFKIKSAMSARARLECQHQRWVVRLDARGVEQVNSAHIAIIEQPRLGRQVVFSYQENDLCSLSWMRWRAKSQALVYCRFCKDVQQTARGCYSRVRALRQGPRATARRKSIYWQTTSVRGCVSSPFQPARIPKRRSERCQFYPGSHR
jgi:hypothetical protein